MSFESTTTQFKLKTRDDSINGAFTYKLDLQLDKVGLGCKAFEKNCGSRLVVKPLFCCYPRNGSMAENHGALEAWQLSKVCTKGESTKCPQLITTQCDEKCPMTPSTG